MCVCARLRQMCMYVCVRARASCATTRTWMLLLDRPQPEMPSFVATGNQHWVDRRRYGQAVDALRAHFAYLGPQVG